MTVRRKTKKALAMLLPAGVLGISSALASAHLEPLPQDRISPAKKMSLVAERLLEIRTGVSEMNALTQKNPGTRIEIVPDDRRPSASSGLARPGVSERWESLPNRR